MASKRHLRRKACEGKRRYEEESSAVSRAFNCPSSVRAYKCPHCKNWHVGHEPARKKQGRLAAAARKAY